MWSYDEDEDEGAVMETRSVLRRDNVPFFLGF